MGYTVHGKTGWRVTSYGELVTERHGLQTATAVYECEPKDGDMSGAPSLNKPHPKYPWMRSRSRRLRVSPRGMYQCVMEYGGVNSESTDDDDSGKFELVLGTAEEPLETHPDFVDKIGGKPSAPINGAVFTGPDGTEYTADNPAPDENARFSHFMLDADGAENKFAGIEAYLDVTNVEWRRTWTAKNPPYNKLDDGGLIDVPGGPVPDIPDGRDWLNLGITARQVAQDCWEMTQTWRLSGRGGWNQKIYKRQT